MIEDDDDLGQRYLAATAALERGEVERARQDFELLVLSAPRFAPAWDGLGTCWDSAGELKRAGECFRKAMRFDRRSWRSRYNWGAALHKGGEVREAIRWLKEAARLAPDERRVLQRLGRCYFDLGDYDAALAAYHRGLELPERDVRDAELYVGLGRAEMERGDLEAADKAFERACLLSPDDPSVYHNWAVVASRQGDREGAERLAIRARALEPRSIRSYLLLVNLAMDEERWRDAEKRIDEMTPLPDAERLVLALRGEVARRQGDWSAAHTLAIEALRHEGGASDHAVDTALGTLREVSGRMSRVTGFRIVVEARCEGRAYYRPYVVLAQDEEEAGRHVAEIQNALDNSPWIIVEVERFAHEGEAQTGVYHVLLTRVLFALEAQA